MSQVIETKNAQHILGILFLKYLARVQVVQAVTILSYMYLLVKT